MKNLNSYGENYIEKVLDYGRLEDDNVYIQVNHVYVSESNTNYLINLEVKEKLEQIYIYNENKYKFNTYKIFFCDEIFTIPKNLNAEKRRDLIFNFVNDMFSNYYNFSYEDISEYEYYLSSDFSKIQVRNILEEKIL